MERLKIVHDNASLLYQVTKEKLGYEQTMKDTIGNEAEEVKEQQQDYDYEQSDTIPKIKLVHEGTRIKEFKVTFNLNGNE